MNELATQTQNRLEEFKARLDATPKGEIWQPSAGETLLGVIVGSETTHHPLYGQQRLMLVQTESGAVVKVWLSRWLIENLRSKDAQQNDLIALTYGGKKRTATGKEYNSFNLMVEK